MSTPETLAGQAFADLTEPFRRELLVHCYRMLGSPQDAEDTVQETYLRAWRGFSAFEGRSSVRTWLYRIATNACLNVLESRKSRKTPRDVGPATTGGRFDVGAAWADANWIEPLPDSLLEPSPETLLMARSSTRLAMVAALQTLSARERAAVILHDVVRLTSAEVAAALDSTPAAVNSSLQRARTRISAAQPAQDEVIEPRDPTCRRALDAYVEAFHTADIRLLVRLLRDDVVIEMPPTPTWFAGRTDVSGFLDSKLGRAGEWLLLPTAANGQPAAAVYRQDQLGVLRAHGLHVLTVTERGIVRIVAFRDSRHLARFGFPDTMPG